MSSLNMEVNQLELGYILKGDKRSNSPKKECLGCGWEVLSTYDILAN